MARQFSTSTFFCQDKIGCLIVVFLVLAALAPHHPSFTYPSAVAYHFAMISTSVTLDSGIFLSQFFHLFDSHLADSPPPPPTHQMAILTRKHWRGGTPSQAKDSGRCDGQVCFYCVFLSVQFTPRRHQPSSHSSASMSRTRVCTSVELQPHTAVGAL